MVRVSQLSFLCLRHSPRYQSQAWARAQVLGWTYLKLPFDRPRSVYHRSLSSSLARTRSGEEQRLPSSIRNEVKHDTTPTQDLIDRINSLNDTTNNVPSEDDSEWSDDLNNPGEIYTVAELEFGNQDTPDFSSLRETLGHDEYYGLSRFLPAKIPRNRTNLSYTDVLEFENAPFESRRNDATSVFNKTGRLRRVMLAFMRHVEPVLNAQPSAIDLDTRDLLLEDALRSVFYGPNLGNLKALEMTHFDISDVACWSWVFTAPSVDLAVLRYVALMEDTTPDDRPRSVPKFVVLQLLRADNIGLDALRRLVECVLRDLHHCRDQRYYGTWNSWITRVSLVVRLLRHAQQTDPSLLDEIASVIRLLFSVFYHVPAGRNDPEATETLQTTTTADEDELVKLAHVFNRFLGLMSSATSPNPFEWSLEQQKAQLKVVGIMADFKPQLPVTREGFRALIKVQLLHKKTDDELAWAEAKSLSWPPWRQDTMGIQRDLVYSGKESRAMRLLLRMKEAGYSHGIWEQKASVLAGWDIDKSPTIQTRSILRRPRVKFFPEDEITESVDPGVWAARVRSTRTRLEAWAAFSAYAKSTPLALRQYKPYYAMLERLLVPTVEPGSRRGSAYLPGDLKATFTDPIDPNQRVYVEKNVPTMNEFYRFMLDDGFRPAGAILCDLLESARNLVTGFQFITESKYNEVIRDVLLHAEKYPHAMLKQNLSQLRTDVLASFYRLLARYGFVSHPQLQMPGSLTEEARGHRLRNSLKVSNEGLPELVSARYNVLPMNYAARLLNITGDKTIPVWNGFLQGLLKCVTDTQIRMLDRSVTQRQALDIKVEVWRCVEEMFNISRLESLELHPDLDTFQHVAWIVNGLVRDMHFQSFRSAHLVDLAKSLFVVAVYGKHSAKWGKSIMRTRPLRVPDPLHIRILVRLMISIHDVQGILTIIKWLAHHADIFAPLASNELVGLHNSEQGYQQDLLEMKHLRGTLCAIRLFLEGSNGLGADQSSSTPESADYAGADDELWFDTPLNVLEEQIETARSLCEPLGWPSDKEVRAFLEQNVSFVFKVSQAADFTTMKENMYADRSG